MCKRRQERGFRVHSTDRRRNRARDETKSAEREKAEEEEFSQHFGQILLDNPRTKHTRLVLMTQLSDMESSVVYGGVDVDESLPKPLTSSDLIRIVEESVNTSDYEAIPRFKKRSRDNEAEFLDCENITHLNSVTHIA